MWLSVTGPLELCQKVYEGLLESARERNWYIVVHQCETIVEIIKSKLNIGIDYIIFLFDGRTSKSLSDVEENLSVVDEHFIVSGAVCLVNCKGISNFMGRTSQKVAEIRNKYNIHFLSANVFDSLSCVQLGGSILNLTEAVLGITSGIPISGLLT